MCQKCVLYNEYEGPSNDALGAHDHMTVYCTYLYPLVIISVVLWYSNLVSDYGLDHFLLNRSPLRIEGNTPFSLCLGPKVGGERIITLRVRLLDIFFTIVHILSKHP